MKIRNKCSLDIKNLKSFAKNYLYKINVIQKLKLLSYCEVDRYLKITVNKLICPVNITTLRLRLDR